MMHGHEKSDLVIVAVKPTNKARKAPCGGVCRGGRSGVGGAKGGGQGEYAPAKHVLDSEPGSRVTGAGAYTATCAVTHPRQEPYAGKPHVRIWRGACHEMHVPTATASRYLVGWQRDQNEAARPDRPHCRPSAFNGGTADAGISARQHLPAARAALSAARAHGSLVLLVRSLGRALQYQLRHTTG